MTIQKKAEGSKLYVQVAGRIDTSTAPQAEKEFKDGIENVKEFVLDLKELDYISSAGLRVLLALQKIMNKQGELRILNVNDVVMEIFEVTGFSDILTIE